MNIFFIIQQKYLDEKKIYLNLITIQKKYNKIGEIFKKKLRLFDKKIII